MNTTPSSRTGRIQLTMTESVSQTGLLMVRPLQLPLATRPHESPGKRHCLACRKLSTALVSWLVGAEFSLAVFPNFPVFLSGRNFFFTFVFPFKKNHLNSIEVAENDSFSFDCRNLKLSSNALSSLESHRKSHALKNRERGIGRLRGCY